MTIVQNQTIWELRRNGFHDIAEQAQARWKAEQEFTPDPHITLNRQIQRLLDICNWEIQRIQTA